MTKVGVCVPTGGTVHAEFAMCLAALLATSSVRALLIHAESSMIQVNRDRAVAHAIAAGCTHVLFLDADMTFPSDAMERLLDHEKDVVGCQYPRRVAPYGPLGDIEPGQTGDLQTASRLGFGCILIRTSVFAQMRAPFFRQVAIEDVTNPPAEIAGIDLTGVVSPDTLSEDYYFCGVARRLGLTVYADMKLSREIGHIGASVNRLGGA